jgi:hypothetical protein
LKTKFTTLVWNNLFTITSFTNQENDDISVVLPLVSVALLINKKGKGLNDWKATWLTPSVDRVTTMNLSGATLVYLPALQTQKGRDMNPGLRID